MMKRGEGVGLIVLLTGFAFANAHGAYAQRAALRGTRMYWQIHSESLPSGLEQPRTIVEWEPTVTVQDLRVSEKARGQCEKGRRLFLVQNKSARSIDFFRRATANSPTYWQAHFFLGLAYMMTRQWREAEESLRSTVSLKQDFTVADLALGSCLVEEQRFSEAESLLLKGLEDHPNFVIGQYDLARAYFSTGRLQEAETTVRKAIALAPQTPEFHFALANILAQRGDLGAAAEFQEYKRLAGTRNNSATIINK
jgi:Flp pilus assembly protein TadD